MHLPHLTRPIATIAGVCALLAIAPAAALAVAPQGVDSPAPEVTSSAVAPKNGSCVNPSGDSSDKPVSYRWRTRKAAWRLRPVFTKVNTHSRPSSSAIVNGSLTQDTLHTGIEAQYLVLNARQVGDTCWLRVRLPAAPRTRAGWVDRDLVQLSRTRWQIEVDRSSRRLKLLRNGRTYLSTKVVIGARTTPTPTTRSNEPFAMYDAKRGSAGEFTGTWQLATTELSDVDPDLGRIGIHGRGGASLSQALGSASSLGCVRINNSVINRIVRTIGRKNLLGVPVVITQ